MTMGSLCRWKGSETSMRVTIMFLGTLLGLVLTAGCADNLSPVAKVGGRITFQGRPVVSGKLLFLPEGGGKQAIGSIRQDGSFELTTYREGDGALVGNHHAVVLKGKVTSRGKLPAAIQRAGNRRLAVESGKINRLQIELDSQEWEILRR